MNSSESENLAEYEASLHPYAKMFRDAFVNKDQAALRKLVRALCDNLNEGFKYAPPITDAEIDALLTTGQAHFPVRSGSYEDRIHIAFGPPHAEPGKGKMFMNKTQENLDHGREARRKFQELFSIPEGLDYKEF